MADDPKKVGKADDVRVSLQDHEVSYLARDRGITAAQAREAIEKAGPMRTDVEAYIKKHWGK